MTRNRASVENEALLRRVVAGSLLCSEPLTVCVCPIAFPTVATGHVASLT